MNLLIKNGRVLDPASGVDLIQDLLIAEGRIARSGQGLKAPADVRTVDATGKVVCPGFIDIHTHLREPGFEYKETVASGTRAAAAGGVAEAIREQLMLQLAAELPYATAVEIERFEDDTGITPIGAVIWVERDGQKGIVIGAGGTQLKKIGSSARRSMERVLDRRVFLELWVRVRESWSDDAVALKQFGYSE